MNAIDQGGEGREGCDQAGERGVNGSQGGSGMHQSNCNAGCYLPNYEGLVVWVDSRYAGGISLRSAATGQAELWVEWVGAGGVGQPMLWTGQPGS